MKLLIVAATQGEILPLPAAYEGRKWDVELFISGVGMLATAYSLTKHLQSNKYDLVLQAGVGGSFSPDIPLGNLVFVSADQYGDLGAEDHDEYIDIFDLGLLDKNAIPHFESKLVTPLWPIHERIALPQVSGITVNTVSGNERTIQQRSKKYNAEVESMEGAAFHYVCLQEGVAFAQVRAISNYVIPRDKSQWKMKDAIINLNKWLADFIEKLNE